MNTIQQAQQRRSALYNHFMNRFQKEYLSFLRETHSLHSKKHQASENAIKTGDVVLVHDTDTPKHRWELGLVESLILGFDKLCRAAVVRTARGRTTRSIIKLYPLELSADLKTEDPVTDTPGPTDNPVVNTRPTRQAAVDARNAIKAHLIDFSQD